jgi:hypothetical protein
MVIKNRERLLVLLVGIVVAVFLGDRIVLGPVRKGWVDRSTRIAELKKQVSQGTVLLGREQNLRQRWEQMRTNTLAENVSTAENEVLRAFERWSQESRISISSIKPQWKRGGDDDYVTLECRADAFGNISAVTRFLYEVEKDPLALKVESVEISARDSGGQQLELGLVVSGLQLNSELDEGMLH